MAPPRGGPDTECPLPGLIGPQLAGWRAAVCRRHGNGVRPAGMLQMTSVGWACLTGRRMAEVKHGGCPATEAAGYNQPHHERTPLGRHSTRPELSRLFGRFDVLTKHRTRVSAAHSAASESQALCQSVCTCGNKRCQFVRTEAKSWRLE